MVGGGCGGCSDRWVVVVVIVEIAEVSLLVVVFEAQNVLAVMFPV